ncbi:MAG TPA: DUF4124 domain-containing protein [Steroidobacteraceae bacterium]|nr:DUF4124 domain-containing protein [Steroidobacteraceae bacterium]
MLRLVPIMALILAGACTLARADVFRWVDDQGVVHYSDEWMPGSVVIKTTVRPHPESGAAPSTASAASRVNEQMANQENARAVQQDVAKARDTQCTWAKDRYMKAIASRRVYKEGKDGERQYMSDADADAYREQARKDVQQACGNVPQWKADQPVAEPQPIPEPKVNPALATSQ